jgi:hypothetical protein
MHAPGLLFLYPAEEEWSSRSAPVAMTQPSLHEVNDAKLGSRRRREPCRRETLMDYVRALGRRLQAVRRRHKVIRSLSVVIGLGPLNDLERRLHLSPTQR